MSNEDSGTRSTPLMSLRLRYLIGVAGGLLLALGLLVLLAVGSEGSSALVLVAFLALPGAMLLLTAFSIPLHDRRLKRRRRSPPPISADTRILNSDGAFDLATVPLPLFGRPLANLWSKVIVVRSKGQELRVFECVHADLLGEGRPRFAAYRDAGSGDIVQSGHVIVSCVLAEVEASMPLVVVRPRLAKPITWPDGLVERQTESELFNRAFRLLTADPYAATAILDARTMRVIVEMDSRFSVEIGGRWILGYAQQLDASGNSALVEQVSRLMETFPRVVESLFAVRRPPPADIPTASAG